MQFPTYTHKRINLPSCQKIAQLINNFRAFVWKDYVLVAVAVLLLLLLLLLLFLVATRSHLFWWLFILVQFIFLSLTLDDFGRIFVTLFFSVVELRESWRRAMSRHWHQMRAWTRNPLGWKNTKFADCREMEIYKTTSSYL